MTKLLLLGCSARKTSDPGLIPAIRRYDGPLFRVVRKYLIARPGTEIQVLVVSARYGLITGDDVVEAYDLKMSSRLAATWRPQILPRFAEYVRRYQDADTLICVGAKYAEAIAGWRSLFTIQQRPAVCDGGVGHMAAQLRAWLYGDEPGPLPRGQASDVVRFRRTSISRPSTSTARETAFNLRGSVSITRGWFVDVEGTSVPAKAFVAALTGMPLGKFNTQDARRLLTSFGFAVRYQ